MVAMQPFNGAQAPKRGPGRPRKTEDNGEQKAKAKPGPKSKASPARRLEAEITQHRDALAQVHQTLEDWGFDDALDVGKQALEAIDYVILCVQQCDDKWTPPAGGAPLGEGSIVAPNVIAKTYFGAVLEGVAELEVLGHPSPTVYLVSVKTGPNPGTVMCLDRSHFTVSKRVKPAPAPSAQVDLEEAIAEKAAQN